MVDLGSLQTEKKFYNIFWTNSVREKKTNFLEFLQNSRNFTSFPYNRMFENNSDVVPNMIQMTRKVTNDDVFMIEEMDAKEVKQILIHTVQRPEHQGVHHKCPR